MRVFWYIFLNPNNSKITTDLVEGKNSCSGKEKNLLGILENFEIFPKFVILTHSVELDKFSPRQV